MKKIDLGQTIGMLANIGVVAGILFLAIELQQNNELMDAERRFNRLTIATGSLTLLATNSELAAAVAKLNDLSVGIDNLDLTPGERTQLRGYYSRVIINEEWTYLELPGSELPVQEWKKLAQSRSWRFHWDAVNSSRGDEFVGWMQRNILEQ